MKKHQNSMIILALVMIFCGFDTMTMVSSQSYFSRFSSQAYDVIGKAIAPLQAGYDSNDQQKADAKKAIEKLEAERKQILVALSTSVQPFTLQRRLKEIDDELYKQKLITGQVWSKQRKIVLGLIASLGAAALGFGAYKYLYQQPMAPMELMKLRKDQLLKVRENPASTPEDEMKAENELKEIIATVPYHSPDLVSLEDVDALRKRMNEIGEQRYPAGFVISSDSENPNFNEEDYRVARKQYNKARLLPQNILKLEKEAEKARYEWSDEARQKKEEYNNLVHELRLKARYNPPSPVQDPHNLDELKDRLNAIKRQRKVHIGSKEYDYVYGNEAEISRDYFDAKRQYEKEYVKEYAARNPYVSPDLVDPHDIAALKKRMEDIEKQRWVAEKDVFDSSPNFNEEYYRMAKKQYQKTVLKEGDFYSKKFKDVFAAVSDEVKFQRAMHIGPYHTGTWRDQWFDYGEEKAALEAFNKLNAQTQLELLTQKHPYVAPPAVNVHVENVQALKDRYEKIKAQQNIEYGDKAYPNLSFNEDDLIKAEQDYVKMKQDEDELIRWHNLMPWEQLREWWNRKPSDQAAVETTQPTEIIEPVQPAEPIQQVVPAELTEQFEQKQAESNSMEPTQSTESADSAEQTETTQQH